MPASNVARHIQEHCYQLTTPTRDGGQNGDPGFAEEALETTRGVEGHRSTFEGLAGERGLRKDRCRGKGWSGKIRSINPQRRVSDLLISLNWQVLSFRFIPRSVLEGWESSGCLEARA